MFLSTFLFCSFLFCICTFSFLTVCSDTLKTKVSPQISQSAPHTQHMQVASDKPVSQSPDERQGWINARINAWHLHFWQCKWISSWASPVYANLLVWVCRWEKNKSWCLRAEKPHNLLHDCTAARRAEGKFHSEKFVVLPLDRLVYLMYVCIKHWRAGCRRSSGDCKVFFSHRERNTYGKKKMMHTFNRLCYYNPRIKIQKRVFWIINQEPYREKNRVTLCSQIS